MDIFENNPLDNEHLAMYEQVVKERGFELCVGVLDDKGKFHVMGNKDMMVTQLNNITTSTRRSSLNWIPPEPLPKLPMPLQELLLNENKNLMKKTASAYIHHFLAEDQQIGKVKNFNYNEFISRLKKNISLN